MLYAIKRPDGTVIEESVSISPESAWSHAGCQRAIYEKVRATFSFSGGVAEAKRVGESLGYRLVRGRFVEEETDG